MTNNPTMTVEAALKKLANFRLVNALFGPVKFNGVHLDNEALDMAISALTPSPSRVDELVAAARGINGFASHDSHCKINKWASREGCTCGYKEALRLLRAALSKFEAEG